MSDRCFCARATVGGPATAAGDEPGFSPANAVVATAAGVVVALPVVALPPSGSSTRAPDPVPDTTSARAAVAPASDEVVSVAALVVASDEVVASDAAVSTDAVDAARADRGAGCPGSASPGAAGTAGPASGA